MITGASVASAGEYSVAPTNPVSVTGGTGTGATFNVNISGEFEYSGQAAEVITLIVFHLDYKSVRFPNFTMPGSSSDVPISQVIDRVYHNP